MLRPGTRAYARSWIRDGTMIGEALLRLGHPAAAADYLRWYAPHQFANGKVPCCIDARGADPVPENDSPGEFIFLVGEVYRYTTSARCSTRCGRTSRPRPATWHAASQRARGRVQNRRTRRVVRAAARVDQSRRLFREAGAFVLGRLLGAQGLRQRSDDREGDRPRRRREGACSGTRRIRQRRRASLRATAPAIRIDYLAGSVELGDFDPTSSTIAFAPGGDERWIPAELVKPTFERYWREFVARRDGTVAWNDYTPYELRNVATFVRLGWRERAHELLQFFMAGRRPPAWNQWPEVVGRDARKTLFVGDLPHAWVASDYIRSVLDLFAYERSDGAMVLAGGIPDAWLDRAGRCDPWPAHAVRHVLLRARAHGRPRRRADACPRAGRVPPGGFVLRWSLARGCSCCTPSIKRQARYLFTGNETELAHSTRSSP
jgi:hypothetical protein